MKKYVCFYIIARDSLDAEPTDIIKLYGDENQYGFMSDLCKYMSVLAPQRLVIFGQYLDGEEFLRDIFFGGVEIDLDEKTGQFYKIIGESRFVLSDTQDGIEWRYWDDNIYA